MVRPATSLRESTLPLSPGHSREGSENSLNGVSRQHLHSRRSASALGAAGGYRQPSSSKSGNALNGGSSRTTHGISQHPLDTTLQPLSEDEDDNMSLTDVRRDSALQSGVTSPAFSYSESSLSRSASVAQMRDIQDQMSGLKGKISSLKEQARADSMKRRSLQSLRTPSPFTHARWDHGYTGSRNAENADNENGTQETRVDEAAAGHGSGGQKTPTNEIEVEALDGDMSNHATAAFPGVDEDVSPGGSPRSVIDTSFEDAAQREVIDDDLHTENGDADDGAPEEEEDVGDVDYASDSDASEYHDSFQNPVSHEDREDAFDYERFFLHSAMGTLSQQRSGRRGSYGSESSDDSVETTRGPTNQRRPSLDTMSSVESFATANEGANSRSSTSHRYSRGTTATPYEDALESHTQDRTSSIYSNSDAQNRPRQNSVVYQPVDAAPSMHRPSISSFDSTGTNRSFPLVNKARLNGGVLTPGGSPDHQLKQISESLMDQTTSVLDKDGVNGSAFVQMLPKEDQLLVEGLVASLGRCVFGLGEASPTSAEGQAYRQRIEAARRILEGSGEAS